MKRMSSLFVTRCLILINDILRNLRKDFLMEFRNKSALSVSLSFAVISTLLISLVAGGVPFSAKVNAVLFWLVMFFSAMNGLAHIFTREEEQGTTTFLRLHSSAEAVYLSKLIFNIIFFFGIQIIIGPVFIFFQQIHIYHVVFFIITVLCSGLAIASSVTILAALVAKSQGRNALFTVISFPIVLPILWVAVSMTQQAFTPGGIDWKNVLFLVAFSGAIITLSIVLFKQIWMDE